MSTFERPGLREQLVTALSNSQLSAAEGRECALDRIGAFGAAQIAEPMPVPAARIAPLPPPPPSTGDALMASIERAFDVQIPLDERAFMAGASDSADAGLAAGDAEPSRAGGVHAYASVALDDPELPAAPAAELDAAAHLVFDAAMSRTAAVLLRVKYLHDASLADQAVALFARHLKRELRRRRDRNRREAQALLPKIAEQALAEWIAGTCRTCHGTGRVGASTGGMRERIAKCRVCDAEGMVRVRLPGMTKSARIACPACCTKRTVTVRRRIHASLGDVCSQCGGDGHFIPREVERMVAIGVDKYAYRKSWAKTFDAALVSARALDRRFVSLLRLQLRGDTGGVSVLAPSTYHNSDL